MKTLTGEQHRELSENAAERRLRGLGDFTTADVRAMREIYALIPPNESGPDGKKRYSPRLTVLLDRQLDIAAHIEGML